MTRGAKIPAPDRSAAPQQQRRRREAGHDQDPVELPPGSVPRRAVVAGARRSEHAHQSCSGRTRRPSHRPLVRDARVAAAALLRLPQPSVPSAMQLSRRSQSAAVLVLIDCVPTLQAPRSKPARSTWSGLLDAAVSDAGTAAHLDIDPTEMPGGVLGAR